MGLVALLGGLLACTAPDMERVPTQEDIRSWVALQPFIIQSERVVGVYQNLDVDCVVFHYHSTAPAEEAFWRELEQRARSEGWAPASPGAGLQRAYRRLKPSGSPYLSSAEELRIAYSPSRVVVGYVQSDQNGDPKPVAEAAEGRFAERHVWPKFNALVAASAG